MTTIYKDDPAVVKYLYDWLEEYNAHTLYRICEKYGIRSEQDLRDLIKLVGIEPPPSEG